MGRFPLGNDVFYVSILYQHFLVVASALMRISGLDDFTHLSMDPLGFSILERHLEETFLVHQEIYIFYLLF